MSSGKSTRVKKHVHTYSRVYIGWMAAWKIYDLTHLHQKCNGFLSKRYIVLWLPPPNVSLYKTFTKSIKLVRLRVLYYYSIPLLCTIEWMNEHKKNATSIPFSVYDSLTWLLKLAFFLTFFFFFHVLYVQQMSSCPYLQSNLPNIPCQL